MDNFFLNMMLPMKRRSWLIRTVIGLLVWTTILDVKATLPLITNVNGHLYKNNDRFYVQGVNYISSLTYAEEYMLPENENHIAAIKNAGANTIRLPLHWERLYDSNTNQLNMEYVRRIDDVIYWCKQHNLYVLLDIHNRAELLFEGTNFWFANTSLINAWSQLAQKYKDETQIIGYDLFNETKFSCISDLGDPVLITVWNNWLSERYGTINALKDSWGTSGGFDAEHSYQWEPLTAEENSFGAIKLPSKIRLGNTFWQATYTIKMMDFSKFFTDKLVGFHDVIAAIRQHDQNHLIFLEPPVVINDSITYNLPMTIADDRIVYSPHFYVDNQNNPLENWQVKSNVNYFRRMVAIAKQQGCPIVIGEFGQYSAHVNTVSAIADSMEQFINQDIDGYMLWCYASYNTSWDNLACYAVNNCKQGTLHYSGQVFAQYNKINNEHPPFVPRDATKVALISGVGYLRENAESFAQDTRLIPHLIARGIDFDCLGAELITGNYDLTQYSHIFVNGRLGLVENDLVNAINSHTGTVKRYIVADFYNFATIHSLNSSWSLPSTWTVVSPENIANIIETQVIPDLMTQVMRNPGFENSFQDWSHNTAPTGLTSSIDTIVYRSGSKSFKLSGPANITYKNTSQTNNIQPNTEYRLSAYVRTNIVSTTAPANIGFTITMRDSGGIEISCLEFLEPVTTTDCWVPIFKNFTTSANATKVQIQIHRPAGIETISSSIWLDDILLSPVSPNLLKNPGFENDLTSWLDTTNSTGLTVSVDSSIFWQGSKSAKFVFNNFSSPGTTFKVSQTIPVKPNSSYHISGMYKTSEQLTGQVALLFAIKNAGIWNSFPRTDYLTVPNEWKPFALDIYTGNDAEEMQVRAMNTNGVSGLSGTLWVDNLSIQRTSRNYVKNCGFEDNFIGWTHENDPNGITTSISENYTGRGGNGKAFKMVFANANEIRYNYQTYQAVNVHPNSNYSFRAWVKTLNLNLRVKIYLNIYDLNDVLVRTESINDVQGTTDWKELSKNIQTGANEGKIMIRFCGQYTSDATPPVPATGTAWFDDVSLRKK